MRDHDLRIGKRDCVTQDGAAIRGIQRHIHSAEQVRAEPAENCLALVRHPRKDVRAARYTEAAQRRRRASRPVPHLGEGPGRAVVELQEIPLRLLARPAVEQRPDHAFVTRGESGVHSHREHSSARSGELRFHSKSLSASKLIGGSLARDEELCSGRNTILGATARARTTWCWSAVHQWAQRVRARRHYDA